MAENAFDHGGSTACDIDFADFGLIGTRGRRKGLGILPAP